MPIHNWTLRFTYYTIRYTHTHTHLTALCPGLPGWASSRKVKPIWIKLKQETVSGSGISWAIYKSAHRSRQITTPTPRHSVFYRPEALPAAQPTVWKHWKSHIPLNSIWKLCIFTGYRDSHTDCRQLRSSGSWSQISWRSSVHGRGEGNACTNTVSYVVKISCQHVGHWKHASNLCACVCVLRCVGTTTLSTLHDRGYIRYPWLTPTIELPYLSFTWTVNAYYGVDCLQWMNTLSQFCYIWQPIGNHSWWTLHIHRCFVVLVFLHHVVVTCICHVINHTPTSTPYWTAHQQLHMYSWTSPSVHL